MLQILLQSIHISIDALLSNKGRSILTIVGIVIGVAAVIIIISVGAGAQSMVLNQIKNLGTDKVGVLPGHSEEDNPFNAFMGFSVTTLKYKDALAIRDKNNVPNAVGVSAYSKGYGKAVWRDNSYESPLSGVTADYLSVERSRLADGRFFTESEERNFSRIAILGHAVKLELFGELEAVGETIKINNQAYRVVGVMAEKGIVAMEDYDDQILLPLKSMQKLIGVSHIGLIRVKVDDEKNIDRVINDVTLTLRERHNISDSSGRSDDFTVRSLLQGLNMIETVTDTIKYFLAAMGALSLIVGGIGIMNIMLISVTERTKEIGLKKAVGANNFHIIAEFLIEAIVVTIIGGILGIILGALISFAVAMGVRYNGFSWDFIISISSVVISLSVSMSIGIIFGFYPAWKASRLEPIEALRYE